MPIHFEQLQNKVRHLRVEWEGEEVNITYSPSANTAATSIAMQEELANEEAGQTKAIITGLERILIGWDVMNGDEKPVPITGDFLEKCPLAFLVAILNAIGEDQAPNRKRSGR